MNYLAYILEFDTHEEVRFSSGMDALRSQLLDVQIIYILPEHRCT